MQNEVVYTNDTTVAIEYTVLNSNECTYIYTSGFVQNELFSIDKQ
jgi:hypothetical protein